MARRGEWEGGRNPGVCVSAVGGVGLGSGGRMEREREGGEGRGKPTACDHRGVVYAAQPAQAVPEGGAVDVGVEDLWESVSIAIL